MIDLPTAAAPGVLAELEARYWAKVEFGDWLDCWVWTAATTNHGYGNFYVGGGRANATNKKAHVVAYELLVGPVPPGLELDHLCRNPPCVNPAHLEAVTHAENMRRSPILGRWERTECKQGHPFDEENTYRYLRDGRERKGCRACARDRMRRRRSER